MKQDPEHFTWTPEPVSVTAAGVIDIEIGEDGLARVVDKYSGYKFQSGLYKAILVSVDTFPTVIP